MLKDYEPILYRVYFLQHGNISSSSFWWLCLNTFGMPLTTHQNAAIKRRFEKEGDINEKRGDIVSERMKYKPSNDKKYRCLFQ